jgi:hypothetical protein
MVYGCIQVQPFCTSGQTGQDKWKCVQTAQTKNDMHTQTTSHQQNNTPSVSDNPY